MGVSKDSTITNPHFRRTPELRFRVLLAGDAERRFHSERFMDEALNGHQLLETTHTLSLGSVLCC